MTEETNEQKLINVLIKLNKEIDKYWTYNRQDSQIKEIRKVQQESLKIIESFNQ